MTPDAIAALLQPYLAVAAPPDLYSQLASYLELIVKWNARINLTAIREPEQIVRRHFGESLFAAAHLGSCATLLDFGSGAGFPGVPIQLLRPEVAVTLAESQGKKASFLHEVVRTLNLPSEVWAGRVESMPTSRNFDATALRAVDAMDDAVAEAARRATSRILILGTNRQPAYQGLAPHFHMADPIPLPESNDGVLLIANRA